MITICKFYSSRSKPKRRYTILSETKVKRHYTYYTDQERNIVILTRPPSPPPTHTHTHKHTHTHLQLKTVLWKIQFINEDRLF